MGKGIKIPPIGISANRLKYDYISKLDKHQAENMLKKVHQAQRRLPHNKQDHAWDIELCTLRGVLAMAENDLHDKLGIPQHRPVIKGRRIKGLTRNRKRHKRSVQYD